MSHRCPVAFLLLLAACASAPTVGKREIVYYPNPPDPPRIQFLRSISAGSDVEPRRSTGLSQVLFGDRREQPKPILKPSALAFRDGVFYVADSELAEILVIDLGKRVVDLLPLTGRAQLMSPQGLWCGSDGQLYVADRLRRQIVVLDTRGEWVREYGPWADDSAPTDVAIWRDRLYVADSGARCVRVLRLDDGQQLHILGKAEVPQQYMRGPSSLAVDGNGFLYAVDTIYSRIFVWDENGKFVRQIGAPGDAPGHLARPKGIACLDDKLLVLDAAFDNCQIFDFDGRTLLFFGGPGQTPGAMSLPRKLWVGHQGLELFAEQLQPDFQAEALIAVANSHGPKISFYALGKSTKFTYSDVALPQRPSPVEPAAAAPGTAGPSSEKRQ